MYDYGLIGNCQVSVLVSSAGSVDWYCLPRPDSPPVFGRLLDSKGGSFSIQPDDSFTSRQYYLGSTNILATHFTLERGAEFRLLDFCPRFYENGRIFRPPSLFRIAEPIKGSCRIRVVCQPVTGWDKQYAEATQEQTQLGWKIDGGQLHLATNASLTHIREASPFLLENKMYFALGWGAPTEQDVTRISEDYLRETKKYWNIWVKHCSIPSLFQKETIRSALVLKLHCYEDTGAILAALTTSLPEEVGASRNWDYRYCWLRDSYFVLNAFRRLGHFEEMEGFLKFLLNVVADKDLKTNGLAPVYSLDHTRPAAEVIHGNWEGYRKSAPVRAFNQAVDHVQNDVYGEMILTLSPIFLDERFREFADADHERLLANLVKVCQASLGQPDAGPWELRAGWQEHSFSNLMCWAGLDRAARIQRSGFLRQLPFDLENAKEQAMQTVGRAVREGSLRNGPSDPSLDSSLLLLPILRYPDRELSEKTVNAIVASLGCKTQSPTISYLYRYFRTDDFGIPKSSFLICSFWLAQALACLGRKQDGLDVLTEAIHAANSLGLFSEHYLPTQRIQAGNFPQAYSHVGLINSAFAVSPAWEEIF